ncbi:MAG TPA: SGNH/GDSL hydrolase family protein [Thermoanaerobaculia bacterium]|nr:SGNH/GDSL hydrolase family protein [Thermoanaerobaculia bacterium]
MTSSVASKASLLATSTLAGLFAVEGALRLFWPQPLLEVHRVTGGDSAFTTLDPELGWRNRPGASGETDAAGTTVRVAINAAGFRDVERATAKVAGTSRIAVLGDSFVFGSGVVEEARMTNLLEARLGGRAEVLNFGVPGYGTDQEWLLLKRDVVRYRPDIVVLVFYVNDLAENVSRVIYGLPKPRFALEAGRLVQVDRPGLFTDAESASAGRNAGLVRWLDGHLHVWVLAKRALDALGSARSSDEEIAATRPPFVDLALEKGVEATPQLDLTLALLAEARRAAEAAGARFLLVAAPHRSYVDPEIARRLLALYRLPGDAFGDEPFRRLRRFAQSEKLAFVDLVPPFRAAMSRGEKVFGPDNVHWNDVGHRLAAEELAKALPALPAR